jgi:hypothetical protein
MRELCRLLTGFAILSLIGGAILYFAALKPLQEQNRPKPDPDICPVCGAKYVGMIKSPPYTMHCAQGHYWTPRADR